MTEVLSLKVENELVDKGSVEITKVDKDSQKVLRRSLRSTRRTRKSSNGSKDR